MSEGLATAASTVLATNGSGLVGTLGFFVPAALLFLLFTVIVVRDRRRGDEPDVDDHTAP